MVPKSIQKLDQYVGVLVIVLTKAINILTLILQISPRFMFGFDKKCKKT